jgi:hypothetical protein
MGLHARIVLMTGNVCPSCNADKMTAGLSEGETVVYLVKFVAQPDGIPPIYRLRQLLKRGLRDLGLRCVSALDVTPGR